MQTFVKLMLRLTTNVATSPAWRRRSSSATRVSAWKSRPPHSARTSASATETSSPSSARPRMRRTSADAQSSVRLPVAPVLMGFLYEAVGVDQRTDTRAQPLGQELRTRRVLGVDGEALAEREAEALGRAPELGDQRPGRFRIDVVDGERRDATPVVEAGGHQSRVHAGRKVRRRLDVDVGTEDEPRDGEGAQQIVERRLGMRVHRNARLGPEVLDDDFLHVAVALAEVANRAQRVHALARRLTDADEQPGGEGDLELARQLDGPQAAGRHLVGRVVVGEPRSEQPLGHALQHEAHAHADLAQRREIALAHHPGVDVGEERRLGQGELADGPQVAERRAVTVTAQELALDGEARLRLVTQREEGFLRSEPPARLNERHHFVGRHRVRARLARIATERAVAAIIAAEGGERHEDLLRKRHRPPPATIAHVPGASEELVEPRAGDVDQPAGFAVRDHFRPTLGRTSWAKRSRDANAALTSGRTGSPAVTYSRVMRSASATTTDSECE